MGQGISGHDSAGGMPSGDRNGKITDGQNAGNGKNKFSDKNEWPPDLEEGKQGKHMKGHPNYQPGKSTLTISMEEAEQLAAEYSGKGRVVGNSKTSNKEWVDFGEIIGIYRDKNGNEYPTTKGIIHHGKNGSHIVPADPEGEY